jgi:oxygen-independent coproporphyrinogen-3 oxidase
MLGHAIGAFGAGGYDYIGMDHFARHHDSLAIARREGRLHRNFQGYTTQPEADLLGLGVSAIGRVGRVYVQNQRLLHDYMAAIDRGELAYERGMELDDDDVLRADVIQALTCYGRIDVKKIEAEHHIDFWTYFLDTLAPLARMSADGLVQVEPNEVTLTPSGRVLVRAVCVLFDRYRREENRHSAVV